MGSLDTVVAFLDRPARQGEYLRALGRRHAAYGARPAHYRVVSELLTDAIVELLGTEADSNTRQDWLDAFTLISEHMLGGTDDADV